MDTLSAFARCQAAQGNEHRVFDWEKAARLILERKPSVVSAGLQDDWEWTKGEIWKDGLPVPKEDTYTYLASNWAIPEIDIDGEIIECYRMESKTPGWGPETYWPKEALKILEIKPKKASRKRLN